MDARPIGMFDSGVGGLTVLHECLVTLPHEDFVYFGDSHPDRFPYGTEAGRDDRRFAHEIAAHLAGPRREADRGGVQRGDGAALPDLQREFAVPLIGVITPEAHAAVQATRNAPGRRDGDRGDGGERPLPGRPCICSTPASR